MKARGGYGSGVRTRSHPRAYLVRFTEEEDQRLSKLLRKRRLTMQAFGHAAILRAINKIELGEEDPQDTRKDPPKKESKGLGIRDRLEKERTTRNERNDREREREYEREQDRDRDQAQRIVPPAGNSVDAEIMTLARTIVDSPKSTRKETLMAACRTLARGRSLEDSLRLADELNAMIRKLEGAPQSALERARARMADYE